MTAVKKSVELHAELKDVAEAAFAEFMTTHGVAFIERMLGTLNGMPAGASNSLVINLIANIAFNAVTHGLPLERRAGGIYEIMHHAAGCAISALAADVTDDRVLQ